MRISTHFMTMTVNRFACFILLFISFCPYSVAQDRFERLYTTSNENFVALSMSIAGSGYLIYSAELDDDGLIPRTNLTKLDQKGNIDWSYSFEYGDSLFVKDIGEVILLKDGNISISALLDKHGMNKVVTTIDPNGTVLWSALFGQEDDNAEISSARSNLIEVNGDKLLSTNILEVNDGTDLFLTSLLYTGDLDWAHIFTAADTSGMGLTESIRDSRLLRDSTVLIAGNLSSAEKQLFLTVLSDSSDIIWARTYTGDFGTGLSQSLMSVTELTDGSLAVLGAQAGSTTHTFLLHLDSSGIYKESWMFRSNDAQYELIPNNVVSMADTSVVISMKRLNLTDNTVEPLIFKFDLDSAFAYQTVLKPSIDAKVDRSGLVTKDSQSVAFLTTIDTNDFFNPYVVKLDDGGQTLCSDVADLLTIDSVFFRTDTLEWTVSEVTEVDSIETISRSYGGFSPPVLMLGDTFFCPQDPVIFTVDASIEGAVAYLWDDMNTDSVRTFFEEGMYSVIVTVGKNICYELCDTTTISVREFPEAAISQNAINFCSTGEILLLVSSQNQITEILWSTGETTPVIAVSELTNYSVQIVDDCGNTAQASIDLSDFTRANVPIIERSDDNLCVDNTISLSVNNIDPANLIWSNGAQGVSQITVDAPGTYTVQNVEPFCPGESNIIIAENDFVPDLSVNIEEFCDNPIILLLSGEGILTQEWSDGSNSTFISVTEAGTYFVTVTNICGEMETASLEITEERVRECIPPIVGVACLQWPNAFIPSSNEENNQTFGPKNDCANVQNYELNIFNRWGENIYTSTSVDIRWNGRVGSELAPPDVYFWWATYSDGNTEFQDEGDVTLIR